MASKQRRPHTGNIQCQRREIMRPIISSDIMGNRNVEIVPVGAWVEPAENDFQPDSVRAAQIEEEKIHRLKDEKENKLRNFQQQTRRRVNKANHLKRQQQIQEAEQAFEMERKVVQQSCAAGDMLRKDTCVIRQDLDFAIRKRLLEKYGEDVDTWGKETVPVLQSRTEESHQVAEKARQQLISKKIAQNCSADNPFENDWKVKTTKDIQIPIVKSVIDFGELPTTYHTSHKKTQFKDTNEDDVIGPENCTEQVSLPKSKSLYGEKNENKCDEKEGKINTHTDEDARPLSANKIVTTDQHRKKKRSWSFKRPQSAQLADILLHDSESDVRARQRKHQAVISRKIFMDRERETVRENIRRQQHRKKIQILKAEKEVYRQQLEDMAHRKLEPTGSMTGETEEDLSLRERMEALQVKEVIDQRQNQVKKTREMKRYLNALRHTLMEKATRLSLQLPSLCACGDSVWDTHPDTCANNCFFYKNHRAYARALQSLLLSADVM